MKKKETNIQFLPLTGPSGYESIHPDVLFRELNKCDSEKEIYKVIHSHYESYEADFRKYDDDSGVPHRPVEAIEYLLGSSFFEELIFDTNPWIHAVVLQWLLNKKELYGYYFYDFSKLKNRQKAIAIYWLQKSSEYKNDTKFRIGTKDWYKAMSENKKPDSFKTEWSIVNKSKGLPNKGGIKEYESALLYLKQYPKTKRQLEKAIKMKKENNPH